MPRRLNPDDADYPASLRDLEAPPPLELRGRAPGPGPRVAIVGSRRPSVEAEGFTRRLAADLARSGALIVSGGAIGVDAAAHRGALDAEAPTWVVLAGDVREPRPDRNRALFDEILQRGGGLLAEADREFRPWELVRRNRLVAALADLLVIVQGDERSGTRHTLEFAQGLGRAVGAVPWCPWDPRGAVPRAALSTGAISVDGASSVRRHLGLTEPIFESRPPLLAALDAGPQTLDALASRTGQSAAEVRAELGRWEIEGRVRRRAGRYERC